MNCIDTLNGPVVVRRPTAGAAYLDGARAVLPILLGVVPFALIAGAVSVEAGLSVAQSIAMSWIVFAGMAQVAAADLLGQGAPLIVVAATALVVNLRFAMYSASMAPHWSSLTPGWKAVLSYFMTDQGYALFVTRYRSVSANENRHWFFLGSGLTLWTVWQIGTIIGAVLGARVPESWSLEFAIPLTMMALLTLTLTDRRTLIAAAVAGGVMLLAFRLPMNLGFLVAAVAGIVTGGWLDRTR